MAGDGRNASTRGRGYDALQDAPTPLRDPPPPRARAAGPAVPVTLRPPVTAFERLGRWAAWRRWWVVTAWAVLLVAAVPLATQSSGALRAGGFIRQDLESARSKQLLHDELGLPEAAVAVVFYSPPLRAGDPA